VSAIKPKLRPCKTCKDPCYVFSHGDCKSCSQMRYATVAAKKRQATLTQTENGKTAKPFKVIAKVSKNRVEALKKYRRLRDKYFEEHPVCEFPGCNSKNITLHHKRGRVGAFLTDKRSFCSLCLPHHRYVENNPEEGRKLNLVLNRL